MTDHALLAPPTPTVTRVDQLTIAAITADTAVAVAVEHHYLHRRPPVSHAYGLYSPAVFLDGTRCVALAGVATFGVPASRHLQKGACPVDPDAVLELNRVWLDDLLPHNTASWFVSRVLRRLPPAIVVSYADPTVGHHGGIYRALSFRYAGWTDMDQATPRTEHVPARAGAHSRGTWRTGGPTARRPRTLKLKYWTTTGSRPDRHRLAASCGWPTLDWRTTPPPALGRCAA